MLTRASKAVTFLVSVFQIAVDFVSFSTRNGSICALFVSVSPQRISDLNGSCTIVPKIQVRQGFAKLGIFVDYRAGFELVDPS